MENGRDTLRIYNSNLKNKKENFDKFAELMKNQFMHGGDKYQLSEDKEGTDLICEMSPGKSGVDFVLQNVAKYCLRFINFKREKDLLKIATYAYICWLKCGFHLEEKHDEDVKR